MVLDPTGPHRSLSCLDEKKSHVNQKLGIIRYIWRLVNGQGCEWGTLNSRIKLWKCGCVTESLFMLPQNPCDLKWALICTLVACKWVCEDSRRPFIYWALTSDIFRALTSYFWGYFSSKDLFGFVMPLNIPAFYQRQGFNTWKTQQSLSTDLWENEK